MLCDGSWSRVIGGETLQVSRFPSFPILNMQTAPFLVRWLF